MHLQDEVRAIVGREGVVARKEHPELAGAIARLRRQGDLVAVLPGVYAPAAVAAGKPARLAALARWAPDGVLVAGTAAQLTFWPTLAGPEVECALRWDREARPGYRFSRRRIAPELVMSRAGVLLTRPSLTALDLCEREGGDAIDRALRTRTATLEGLWEAFALSGGRRGNADRRALLVDSRDRPWSEAERLAHRLLRAAGVKGWKANPPVVIEGQLFYLDIAFGALRLVVEIDGRLHEDDEEVFENDRWRQNALVGEGWTVLRFTWRMLQDHPGLFAARVQQEIRSIRSARSRWRGGTGSFWSSNAPE